MEPEALQCHRKKRSVPATRRSYTGPMDRIDRVAIADWIDDRLIDFVRTYLSLHENEYYLKRHMVQDPVAGVRFPKHAAAATLEGKGKTYYFIGEQTMEEFKKRESISAA